MALAAPAFSSVLVYKLQRLGFAVTRLGACLPQQLVAAALDIVDFTGNISALRVVVDCNNPHRVIHAALIMKIFIRCQWIAGD